MIFSSNRAPIGSRATGLYCLGSSLLLESPPLKIGQILETFQIDGNSAFMKDKLYIYMGHSGQHIWKSKKE